MYEIIKKHFFFFKFIYRKTEYQGLYVWYGSRWTYKLKGPRYGCVSLFDCLNNQNARLSCNTTKYLWGPGHARTNGESTMMRYNVYIYNIYTSIRTPTRVWYCTLCLHKIHNALLARDHPTRPDRFARADLYTHARTHTLTQLLATGAYIYL